MESKYDVIVAGTGAAGLFAALSLPENLNVLMITKDKTENSNSYLAQGGICTLREESDFEDFFEDTLRAGRYENNHESVKCMIEGAAEVNRQLVSYGVEFDRGEDGDFDYTREGAHSSYRILHHKDVTGKEITGKLIDAARKRKNIHIEEYTLMMDLVMEGNRCCGIVVKDAGGQLRQIQAKAVILATGGMGGLFEHSTNFRHITGDSFAMASKHHIKLKNLNYIQIHPTVLYSNKPGRGFLISESVRGEGAILINNKGERFVDELLPRDVVSAAIQEEMRKTRSDCVYLSLVGKPEEWIRNRFPNIYQKCLEEGYDLCKEPIPITPAQHYLMGGIETNTNGETSAKNLYAVGETGCNGVHGANRLASNSLLEGLVFAKRAAALIEKSISLIAYGTKKVDLAQYADEEAWQAANRKLIMNEIKRRDEKFYDQWCDHKN
ncbi:L-aspartate oxidase [Anaerovorax odorimutans]|uniref:L-aspartate oxidase n=1 Tax=Anaerovorax odorimutans TaxID=109327 RepID=A0ABT1RT30_9FIRM|nr:L-aspartate oxidase [Anaerovorax odorimutans]MCQ4638368.1 L-aspartate oxidase [Anaerovorax odorimutans]